MNRKELNRLDSQLTQAQDAIEDARQTIDRLADEIEELEDLNEEQAREIEALEKSTD